jgi:hypothetical protein
MRKGLVVTALMLVCASATADEMMKKKEPAPAGGAAAAQPAPPPAAPEPPKPAPELDAMKGMEGTWKCTGKAAANPMMGPEHATAATLKVKRDLDKFWYVARYEGKKSKTDPMPWKGADHWTYDAAMKKWARLLVDNMGGWMVATSSGWVGDKMVFEGEANGGGMKMGFRQTFTKKSDKEMGAMVEMAMDPKRTKWTQVHEETCKK